MGDVISRTRLGRDKVQGLCLCVEACPGVLRLAPHLNHIRIPSGGLRRPGCTGCGMCFYACPEPGAITSARTPIRPK